MHLATSVDLCALDWWDPTISLMLINVFYINARHQMVEVARQDKNGMLLGVMVSAMVSWACAVM